MSIGPSTRESLARALARECEQSRRCLHAASRADAAGDPELGELLREVGRAQSAHALAILDLLQSAGEGGEQSPRVLLERALQPQAEEARTLYPELAAEARREGSPVAAELFARLATAEAELSRRLEQALSALGPEPARERRP